MSEPEQKNEVRLVSVILAGVAFGMIIGAGFGVGLAFLTGTITNMMGWFLILHGALAMMFMGAWTAPCFLIIAEKDLVQASGENDPTRTVRH